MDTRNIKILGIISNVLLVLGVLMLLFVSAWLALICFIVSLGLSLVLFNMLFHGNRTLKIVVNASYFIVLVIVICVIFVTR
ncbi:membrane protein [Staphylococcus schleiferi]|uniref:Uncharacterized protein n=2 Tax=Staphylococcus TaxID=1279 RepID=A0A9X1DU93_9STAP|nr:MULTISPECIES: hypothetical protein [Staphylococcus]QGS46089.1 hypothetical protein FOB90_05060 [Mammaliicoccus fleurettii]AKS66442.1 membrane protein [Staphylococcus schleiferi]AKS68559.1 membrane protein [Staphylococcus schleiferi]AKS70784.1 membrane protein [Staphylococcus schleiferi]AKS72954.1 membrane protein [Staphylococcus schleiferi]